MVSLVPKRIDPRCLPLEFRVNASQDPIPNPLGPAFLTVAEATVALQAALDSWNAVPTSFVEMHVSGTTDNPGLRKLDFVNEITFRPSLADVGRIATSFSLTLEENTQLTAGDDIDEDGDPDVAAGITLCADADGDGDIEFPEGSYAAGTILDTDVELNTAVYRLTTSDEDLGTDRFSADLEAIAAHEFGHSLGLGHSLINRLGPSDGTTATMFANTQTDDPVSERARRSLELDDRTWGSFAYPEGSAASGPGALQPGDVAFDEVFGLVTGTVRHGALQQEILGAEVFAIDKKGSIAASAISGHGPCWLDFANPSVCYFLADPDLAIDDGAFVLPLPKGAYRIGVEAADDSPALGSDATFYRLFGRFLGQHDFAEEFFDGKTEADLELKPGKFKKVAVKPGKTTANVDVITNRQSTLRSYHSVERYGSGSVPGELFAMRIRVSDFTAVDPLGDTVLLGALVSTSVLPRSGIARFSELLLTRGTIASDGTALIDLKKAFAKVKDIVGQTSDLTPVLFPGSSGLMRKIRKDVEKNGLEDLFLVLRTPLDQAHPEPGGLPLIGIDDQAPIVGRSFYSSDGGATFDPVPTVDFAFELVFSDVPPED